MASNDKNKEKPRHPKMYIFWCYTPFHDLDWFYYAESKKKAKDWFNYLTGYYEDDLKAIAVCKVPEDIPLYGAGNAEIELLEKLDFEFLSEGDPLIVRYQGRIFIQGNGDNVVFNYESDMVPSVYLMQIMNTDHYKIGYSSNVHLRRKQLSSNTPYYVTILAVIKNPLAKRLEGELLRYFKKFSTSREWLTLDNWSVQLLSVIFSLYHEEFSERDEDYLPTQQFMELSAGLKIIIESHRFKKEPSQEHVDNFNKIKESIKRDIIKDTNTLKFFASSHSDFE